MRCPLYSTVQVKSGTLHLCRSTHPLFYGLGCHCAVNVAALTANPHGLGCIGRDIDPELGWGPHLWPNRRARVWSVVAFLRGR